MCMIFVEIKHFTPKMFKKHLFYVGINVFEEVVTLYMVNCFLTKKNWRTFLILLIKFEHLTVLLIVKNG